MGFRNISGSLWGLCGFVRSLCFGDGKSCECGYTLCAIFTADKGRGELIQLADFLSLVRRARLDRGDKGLGISNDTRERIHCIWLPDLSCQIVLGRRRLPPLSSGGSGICLEYLYLHYGEKNWLRV